MKFQSLIILLLLSSGLSYSAETLEQYSQNHQIHCSGGQCPEAIGTLVTSTEELGKIFCRAFSISSNKVMTSAHCIEHLLKDKQCSNNVYFKFNSSNVSAECENISFVTFDGNNTSAPDLAILELKQPISVKPLQLERSSFNDEESLYFFKSSYDFKKNSSEMKRVNCRAKKYSVAAGEFFSSRPRTIAMSDCPFNEGDSGNPIFNSRGKVVAVLHGGLDQDNFEAMLRTRLHNFGNKPYSEVLKLYSTPGTDKFNFIITATTVTCLPIHEAGGNPQCARVSVVKYLKDELAKADYAYSEVLSRALKQSAYHLEFAQYGKLLEDNVPVKDLKPSDYTSDVVPRIDCSQIKSTALIPIQTIVLRTDSYFRTAFSISYKTVPASTLGCINRP